MDSKPQIIDFSAHHHPEDMLPQPLVDSGLVDRVGSKLYRHEDLAAHYEQAGYDGAVLSQPFYMGGDDVNLVAEANDGLLEIIDDYDEFYGLAALPVSAGGDVAAAEFERCLDNGYHGGGIETKTDGIELIDADLEPVFEVAQSRDVPLFVHPKLDESLHPDALDDTYLLNAVFGREIALCESICKAIYEGVLNAYPELKLVYHHTGGNLASLLGRVELHLRDGWWPNQEKLPSREAFFGDLEKIYVDTAGFNAAHTPVRAAVETFPTTNVLLGTDCPFEARTVDDMAAFVDAIEDCTDTETGERVLGGNALELLGDG